VCERIAFHEANVYAHAPRSRFVHTHTRLLAHTYTHTYSHHAYTYTQARTRAQSHKHSFTKHAHFTRNDLGSCPMTQNTHTQRRIPPSRRIVTSHVCEVVLIRTSTACSGTQCNSACRCIRASEAAAVTKYICVASTVPTTAVYSLMPGKTTAAAITTAKPHHALSLNQVHKHLCSVLTIHGKLCLNTTTHYTLQFD